MIKEIKVNDEILQASNDFIRFNNNTIETEIVFFEKNLTINKTSSIYNAFVFYEKLSANTIYSLTIDDIQLIEGNINEITFGIKDKVINKVLFTKNLKIGERTFFLFSTLEDVFNLELKLYTGAIGKSNDKSIIISNLKLEKIKTTKSVQNNIYFFFKIEQIYLGYKLALEYCSNDKNTFYIIANRHIGDDIRYFNLLKGFREYYGQSSEKYHLENSNIPDLMKRKFVKKIIIMTTKSISGVARLYNKDIDDIIILSKEELSNLEAYSLFPGAMHHNIIPDEDANYIVGNTFYESAWARAIISGVGDHLWNLALPKTSGWSAMEISDRTKKETMHIIEKNHIDVNNTMIICPVSQSSSMFNSEIWTKFALLQKDVRVFTNVAGNEVCIPNTELLRIDIDILCCLADLGCKIIGVQSGLMDVFCRYGHSLELYIIHLIIKESDKKYAENRNAKSIVNRVKNLTRIRIENFNQEYVVKLLDDVFNKRDLEPGYVLPQPPKEEQ